MNQGVQQTYEEAFRTRFGEPAPTQDWGFGESAAATRALTRVDMPAQPTFRDDNPISQIAEPDKPSFSNTVPTDVAHYAKDYQNYQNGDVLYINTAYPYLNNAQNYSDLTIYVDGDVTYYGGISANGNGTTIVVTENSTLKLGVVNQRLNIYLAPNATLDLSERLNWEGKTDTDWQGNPYTSFSLSSTGTLYMSSGSTVTGLELQFFDGYTVVNDGGTIDVPYLHLDKTCHFWNKGTIDVDNEITLDNSNDYLYNSGTITATSIKYTNESTTIWNDGTITLSGALILPNQNDFIYNAAGKSITASSITLSNNNNLLYNDGDVTVSGNVELQNSSAEVVNNGTLTISGDYSQAAGGKMHNVGTTTVTGNTDLTNSNSEWMNEGQYTTANFTIDNYSKKNYNNCKLTVTGEFYLNRGEFVLEGGEYGASVVTNSFTWEDTSNFWMNSKSLLKVTGTLLTRNYNSGYGFRGVGTEYAVIQAGSIAIESNEQFRMSYFGNLFVDTDNHFAQWYKDAPNTNQPCYYYDDTVKFSFNEDACPVSIPQTKCTPGYNGGGGSQPNTRTDVQKIRVIAEDLTVDQKTDFDFNDVVFDVIWTRNFTDDALTSEKVEVTLQAADGTLPLYVDGKEVHDQFGVARSVMVNTKAKAKGYNGKDDATPVTWTVTNYSGSTIGEIANSISVYVTKTINGVETDCPLTAPVGEVASKVAVGTDYDWCDERQDIDEKYSLSDGTSLFKDYVKGLRGEKWYMDFNKK